MKEKIKIGILGCANIAEKYAIRAFQSVPSAELVSIASRDYGKAKEWASRFGLRAEESYESLISNPVLDAVYIPLPIGLHKEWAIKAALAGKHIICEKSLAENFTAVKEIVDLCRRKEIVLYENFMCDFHPQHQKIVSLIKEGAIGRPFVFKGYFGFPFTDKNNFRYSKSLGGGSLNDAGAYTVFMARKILNSEPLAVTARLDNDENPIDVRGTAFFEFPDGASAFLGFGFDAVYQNNYSVWGSEGLITVGRAYSIPPEMKPTIELLKNENLKEVVTSIDASAANQFELNFSDFCDTILHKEERGKKINSIYSKILAQARVLEAIRLSTNEKRRVELNEIK
ncbi:MAG: Dehydrogenase/oxidoreductase [Candidatus Jorgensenbacteria bacterium GW2011_GWA1_48_11]|uniref:Dehydrogenase/oxidoreductase n=1 Tax=Candidatus Jorgensenbacteria bacterium GW2011_GWA1_48_11 TaxID=1618660 RepID=A0A0G1UBK5_9BACT|nr:MAG: Dehydrogenase/oxidoreductase [Candidatus Jorgensenbacteria bacterium GW2011_GWA1_48_11]KKW11990.1 MAG: Dehydrogenase/oxidoreductase [Candidatus Jorgensenbacteria bacterium GW2011_GWB1_49_9]